MIAHLFFAGLEDSTNRITHLLKMEYDGSYLKTYFMKYRIIYKVRYFYFIRAFTTVEKPVRLKRPFKPFRALTLVKNGYL